MDVGHAFGIIFAIIVMAFVIFIGFEQITNVICLTNVGQTNSAVKSLENVVDQLQASGEGSTETFRMSIPSNARVCFIDPNDPRPNIAGRWMPDPDLYPIIEQKIRTGRYNVWIEYNCGTTEPGYAMRHISPREQGQEGNFCIGPGESLVLTSTGIFVRIEKSLV